MIKSIFKQTILILCSLLLFSSLSANHLIAIGDTVEPEEMIDDEAIPLPDHDSEPSFAIDEVYKVVERMPALKGCGDLKSAQERNKCTEEKLKKYLDANLKYPVIAREKGVEGTVFIKLRVDRNGRVFDPRIIRDIGDGCGEEALRVINKMNDNEPMWTAGMQRGKKVLVEMNIPIRFSLEPETEKPVEVKPFEVVETMPTINDCKNFKTNKEREKCTNRILLEYLYENIKYPDAAVDNDTEGEVLIEWTISKTGAIENIRALSNVGDGCEEEVMRLIKEMEQNGFKWNAGTQRGKNVYVRYKMPVRFGITKSIETKA